MSLETIINWTQNMTTPNTIIQGLDVTGYFFEVFIYGILVLIILATSDHYDRISKRIATGSFVAFTISTLFYAVDFIGLTCFFRVIIILVLSIIYLYSDEYFIKKSV